MVTIYFIHISIIEYSKQENIKLNKKKLNIKVTNNGYKRLKKDKKK